MSNETNEDAGRAPLATWPDRIWLQHGAELLGKVPAYAGVADVTWCAGHVNDNDVEYVRADIAADCIAALEQDCCEWHERHNIVRARLNAADAEVTRLSVALTTMQGVPEGWKLVPKKSTDAMYEAAGKAENGNWHPSHCGLARKFWPAMLAAAPVPPVATVQDEVALAAKSGKGA